MADQLTGTRVAALVAKGFEQEELIDPQQALARAGAIVHVVSPDADTVRAWNHTEWGQSVPVDRALDDARAEEYDALLLPGGVMNPDQLRMNPKAVEFVKQFFDDGKPIAVICHGPWTLIEADALRDRRVTSWPSLKTDLRNAGAIWVDGEVIEDRGIITSRKPDDIPAFNQKMIEVFADSMRTRATTASPSSK